MRCTPICRALCNDEATRTASGRARQAESRLFGAVVAVEDGREAGVRRASDVATAWDRATGERRGAGEGAKKQRRRRRTVHGRTVWAEWQSERGFVVSDAFNDADRARVTAPSGFGRGRRRLQRVPLQRTSPGGNGKLASPRRCVVECALSLGPEGPRSECRAASR